MFSKLFEEGQCQECCGESFGFSNCKLLVDIGPFKAGTVVASIWYFTETGILAIYPTEKELQDGGEFKFKAGLQVFGAVEETVGWSDGELQGDWDDA